MIINSSEIKKVLNNITQLKDKELCSLSLNVNDSNLDINYNYINGDITTKINYYGLPIQENDQKGCFYINFEKFKNIISSTDSNELGLIGFNGCFNELTIMEKNSNDTFIDYKLKIYDEFYNTSEYLNSSQGESILKLKSNEFLDIIKNLNKSVGKTNIGLPSLKNYNFKIKDNALKIVTVDGYRLSVYEKVTENYKDTEFNLHYKDIQCIERLLKKFQKDYKKEFKEYPTIEFLKDENIITVKIGNYEITTNPENIKPGNFLEYESIIPQNSNTKITINTSSFKSVINKALKLFNDKNNIVILDIKKNNDLVIRSHDKTMTATIIGEQQGENLKIAFNAKYLKDMIDNVNSDTVTMEFNSRVAPCKLTDNNYTYIVLPYRLKEY